MSRAHWRAEPWNPWKLTAIGMGVVFVTALITGVVVANYVGSEEPQPGTAVSPPTLVSPPTPAQHAAVRPAAADIEACNKYAGSIAHDKTTQTLTDALIGGAIGAGLGAASGAIADGGSGAGKGAGIGGLVGAAAGTLYGLNESNKHDARAAAAYRACMRRHGYAD